VDPFLGNSIRIQVTTGYDYKKDPKKSIVDFFHPGYITQIFGFTYDKLSLGTTRFRIALKEIFTDLHSLYSDNTDTEETENLNLKPVLNLLQKVN